MSEMPAARLGDDIAHSQAGLGMLLGVLGGVVAGAVLVGATIATGGAALAVVAAVGGAAGLTSFAGLAGMNIGSAMMGPPTGKFVLGSPNVLINNRPATLTFVSMAACLKEAGVPIPLATGSSTVTINIGMAGREGEKLGCSAVSIKSTSPDVFIGGESAQDPRVDIKPEVPAWAVTALQVLGVAGAILALPFAIATVGVAATIGGAVVGYFGSEYGGKAGRALGEALGMSEAGKRAMEAGGQFLGGMVGGAAGAKGVKAFNSRYQITTIPGTLGANGGNIRIVPRNPAPAGKNPYNISTKNMTAAERSATVEYAQRSNEWLAQNGPTKVQPTAGTLRSQANAAARTERLNAARAGKPYQGQAGHVPDTALTGDANPPAGWLDMPGKSNSVAGGGLSSKIGKTVDVITVDGKIP